MTQDTDAECVQTAHRYVKALEDWFIAVTAPDFNEDEYREQSGFDPIRDPLDIIFFTDARKCYRGCVVTLVRGGPDVPDVYVDTCNREVKVYWDGNRAIVPIPIGVYDCCDLIDDWAFQLACDNGVCACAYR